jgi:hypothetical protein
MYDTTIQRTSRKPSGSAARFGGVRWGREDFLDFGVDFLLRREDSREFREYREKRLAELGREGVPFSGGMPFPGILFSAVTFPYGWSSSRKLRASEDVMRSVAANFAEKQAYTDLELDPVTGFRDMTLMSSGDVLNASEQMKSILEEVSSGGNLSGRTPPEDPWGCFSAWVQLSTDPTVAPEEDKSVVQANFTFAEELSGFLDLLWDIPEIRRERIWSVVEKSVGRACGYLYSQCFCGVDRMWGVAARALSEAETR